MSFTDEKKKVLSHPLHWPQFSGPWLGQLNPLQASAVLWRAGVDPLVLILCPFPPLLGVLVGILLGGWSTDGYERWVCLLLASQDNTWPSQLLNNFREMLNCLMGARRMAGNVTTGVLVSVWSASSIFFSGSLARSCFNILNMNLRVMLVFQW